MRRILSCLKIFYDRKGDVDCYADSYGNIIVKDISPDELSLE